MKNKLFIIATALMLVLVGCNTNNQEGRTGNRTNTENTGFDHLNRNDTNRMNVSNRDGNTINRTRNMQDNTNRTGDYNQNRNNNDQYDISQEAAEKIVRDVKSVDRAYVLTTNNNAYVAVVMDNNHDRNKDNNRNYDDDLSDDVKDRIANTVKSVDNNIDNVYVSTNPDFVDLVNGYVNDVNNGHPVRGFFDEMGDMIQRVFPHNRG